MKPAKVASPEPMEEEVVVSKKRVSINEYSRAVTGGITLNAVVVKGLEVPSVAFELNKICDGWGTALKPSFMGVDENDLLEPNPTMVVLGWDKYGSTVMMALPEFKRKRDAYYRDNPRNSSLGQFITKMRDFHNVKIDYRLPHDREEACEPVPRFKLAD
jgi:hypothetical protein